jgi:hypothetical protein
LWRPLPRADLAGQVRLAGLRLNPLPRVLRRGSPFARFEPWGFANPSGDAGHRRPHTPAAGGLDLVHRAVGIARQLVAIAPVIAAEDDADAGAAEWPDGVAMSGTG